MPIEIFFRYGMPRIRRELLHAERNTFFLGVELEHDDLDLFPYLNDFRRMIDPSPGHVADMQNPVDTAEINKSAVAGDIFYRAFKDHALFEDS